MKKLLARIWLSSLAVVAGAGIVYAFITIPEVRIVMGVGVGISTVIVLTIWAAEELS